MLKTEAGAVRGEEITVALLARVGRGEAKEAMTSTGDGFLGFVCVKEFYYCFSDGPGNPGLLLE